MSPDDHILCAMYTYVYARYEMASRYLVYTEEFTARSKNTFRSLTRSRACHASSLFPPDVRILHPRRGLARLVRRQADDNGDPRHADGFHCGRGRGGEARDAEAKGGGASAPHTAVHAVRLRHALGVSGCAHVAPPSLCR